MERGFQEAVDDAWEKTLSQIPTAFGRLAYLASLREANSGKYRHYGLARIYGDEEAHRAINRSHEEVFAEWLSFDLRRQREDLETYLKDAGEEPGQVLETWRSLRPYVGLAPAGSGEAERYLFTSDLEVILDLMRTEASGSSPSP